MRARQLLPKGNAADRTPRRGGFPHVNVARCRLLRRDRLRRLHYDYLPADAVAKDRGSACVKVSQHAVVRMGLRNGRGAP